MSHHLSFSRTALATLLATTLSAGLIGCGSDGSTASTTIDGSAFASAINGAACTIEDVNGNIIVDNIMTVAGDFTAAIPDVNLADDLVLNVDGGTDYRLRTLQQVKIFHYPHDSMAANSLLESFERLVPDIE